MIVESEEVSELKRVQARRRDGREWPGKLVKQPTEAEPNAQTYNDSRANAITK
jgi:hypothetical protein